MDINQSSLSGYQQNNKTRRTGIESRPASEATRAKEISATSASDTAKAQELREGQTVKAQVVDIRYNEVKVQLEPGKQVVTARLAGDIPLSIGQEAQFVVTEKNAEHLVLKYLPEQSANPNEATIQKALTASGFPVTDRNRELVAALLDNRMPVDKQTLQAMIKYSVTNREASPLTLVLMFKNKLPMTPANIKQFEAYQTGTHQLLNDIQKISQNISQILRQDTGAQNQSPAAQAQPSEQASGSQTNSQQTSSQQTSSQQTGSQQIGSQQTGSQQIGSQQIGSLPAGSLPVTSEYSSQTATPLENAVMINKELLNILYGGSTTPLSEAVSESAKGMVQTSQGTMQAAQDVSQPLPGTAQAAQDALQALPNTIQAAPEQLLMDKAVIQVGNQSLATAPDAVLQQQLTNGLTDRIDTPFLGSLLRPEERARLADTLADLPQAQQIKERFAEGTMGLKEALTYIRDNLSLFDTSSAGTLLQSPEYSKLLQEAFLHKWTITPEETAQKAPVADLYQQLKEDLEKINSLVKNENSTTEATRLETPVKNLQDNLQFMKDLNDVFTYLQLPVQFKDQTAHTDLYVMTRKKALSDSKDNLSVLLHLDMTHLGSLNVHIRMNPGSHIQADFYIDNKEAAGLIQENLPSLTTALEKKGYHLESEVKDTYKKPDFSKDFIEQSSQDNGIRRYSFDIRT